MGSVAAGVALVAVLYLQWQVQTHAQIINSQIFEGWIILAVVGRHLLYLRVVVLLA